MIQMLRTILTVYLIVFFSAGAALASSKKEVAVVEIFDQTSTKTAALLRHKLEKKLMASKKVGLISPEKVAGYFNKTEISPEMLTNGDRFYLQAENHFFNFELKEAHEVLARAIDELEKRPGVSGSLVKAHVLKAQIELEQNNNADAFKSVETAISYNISATGLDSYNYPPKLQNFYKKVYSGFSAKTKLVDLTVAIRGSDNLPIYVNGVNRGMGPTLTIQVPENIPQLVSGGNSVQGPITKVTADEASHDQVNITARNINKTTTDAGKSVGFQDASTRDLVEQALWLGTNIKADQIALMKLTETGYLSRLTVTVVDVKGHSASQTKQIDLVDVTEDADTAVNVAADFITGLSNREFTKAVVADEPLLVGKKKKSFFKTPIPWIIVGVVVAGAGAGLALGMGGGGGGGSGGDGDTTTNISGPAPSIP